MKGKLRSSCRGPIKNSVSPCAVPDGSAARMAATPDWKERKASCLHGGGAMPLMGHTQGSRSHAVRDHCRAGGEHSQPALGTERNATSARAEVNGGANAAAAAQEQPRHRDRRELRYR